MFEQLVRAFRSVRLAPALIFERNRHGIQAGSARRRFPVRIGIWKVGDDL
jgi:hypothetical protein